jgi:predicted naringenin-chalcone synthase
VDKIVERAGIDTRHTCVTAGGAKTADAFVARIKAGGRARAEVWEAAAPAMAVRAAREALAAWRDGSAADVTHVVVHSCTGFSAPGVDFALITQLGLPLTTRKIPVHFAGCFGGFTTMYVAKQVVEADPTGRAVVLVACVEACTAHMGVDPRPELVVGNTVFADGAGAAVITAAGFVGRRGGAAPPPPAADAVPCTGKGVALGGDGWGWGLGAMASQILPNSGDDMTWKNSAEPGRFDMWLSRDIPRTLSSTFVASGFGMLRRVGITNPFTCGWAIHP